MFIRLNANDLAVAICLHLYMRCGVNTIMMPVKMLSFFFLQMMSYRLVNFICLCSKTKQKIIFSTKLQQVPTVVLIVLKAVPGGTTSSKELQT